MKDLELMENEVVEETTEDATAIAEEKTRAISAILEDSEDETTEGSSEEKESDFIPDNISTEEEAAYLKELEDLPFIELINLKKQADTNIINLREAKSLIETFERMDLGDGTNRNIMMTNMLLDRGIHSDFREFKETYQEKYDMLRNIIEKAEKIIESKGENINNTSFLTEEMLKSIDKRINKLKPEALNYEYNKKRFLNVRKAFENRIDLTFLSTKADGFLSNKNNVKAYKKFAKNKEYKKSIMKDLHRVFNEDIITRFDNTISEYLTPDSPGYILFHIFLARTVDREKKTGNDAYVKAMVLNIGDLGFGNFDLMDPDEYKHKLYDELLSKFDKMNA